MTNREFTEELLEDYGHNLSAYQDSIGNWRIGAGHKLVANELLKYVSMPTGERLESLTEQGLKAMITADWAKAYNLVQDIFPQFDELSPVRQRAMVHLAYDMGKALTNFKGFLSYMAGSRYSDAAALLEFTLWYRQNPKRSSRVWYMIETGEVPEVRYAAAA